jgi:excisionase family DNA binding protein
VPVVMKPDAPLLLTPAEAAALLALTRVQVLRLAREGVIPSIVVNRRCIRFPVVGLREFVAGTGRS